MQFIVTLLVGGAISFLFAAVAELRFGHTSYFESGAIFYAVIAWQTWERKNLRVPLIVAMLTGWLIIGYGQPLVSTSSHSHFLLNCPFDPCCGLSGITSGVVGSTILVLGTWLLIPARAEVASSAARFRRTLRHIIWAISIGTIVFAAFVPGIRQNLATRDARERLLNNIDLIQFRDAGRELIAGKPIDEDNYQKIDLTELPDVIASTNPSHGFVAYGYLALYYGPTGNISLVVVQDGDQRSWGKKLLVDGVLYEEDPW